MSMAALRAALAAAVGDGNVGVDVRLAPFTTFKVGGPADLFVEPRNSDELLTSIRLAAQHDVPLTMLGGGSNVLISDEGIRGLVVRPRGGEIVRVEPDRVRADAAVTINGLVRWLISHELAGLEAWAGTPGTVGGGIYGNAHWGGRLLSEFVASVRLASRDGRGHQTSRRARWPSATTGAGCRAAVKCCCRRRSSSTPATRRRCGRTRAGSLHYRKRTQPLASPSAGCIFQNPLADVALPDGMPRSAGALVDRAGLKGAREGGAVVSPTHANFVVNTGDCHCR